MGGAQENIFGAENFLWAQAAHHISEDLESSGKKVFYADHWAAVRGMIQVIDHKTLKQISKKICIHEESQKSKEREDQLKLHSMKQ